MSFYYFNLAAVFNQCYFYQASESDSNESVQNANIFVDKKLTQNLILMEAVN